MSKLTINGTTEFKDSLYVDETVKSLEVDSFTHKYIVPDKVLKDVDRFGVTIPRIYKNVTIGIKHEGTVAITVYEDIMNRYDKSIAYIFDTARWKHIPAVDHENPTTAHDIFTIASNKNEEKGEGRACFKTVWNKRNGRATCYFRGKLNGKVTGDVYQKDSPSMFYRTMFDKAGFGVKIVEISSSGDIRSIAYTNDISTVVASTWALEGLRSHFDVYVNNGNGTYYLLRNPKVDLFYNGLHSM